jgi:uncharacterized protein YjdB
MNRPTRSIRPWSAARVAALLLSAVLLACGDDAGPSTPAEIVITPNRPHVPMGETLQLTVTVVDENGRAVEGESVAFASSDGAILTVDEEGLLTSVGGTGTSVITATSGSLEAEVEAQVVLTPLTMAVSPASLALEAGAEGRLHVTVTDENADSIPDAAILFATTDAFVASVNTVGAVTGGAPGTATITITSGDYVREVPVTVTQVPHSVTLTPSETVLSPGSSAQLTGVVRDLAEAPIEDASITWSSSDETILTVSATGMVQSSGPEGLVTIKATYLSFSDSAFVYVGTPPEGEVLSTLSVEEAWRVTVTPAGRYLVATISDELLSGTLPSFALTGSIPLTGTAVGLTINQAADRAYVVRGTTDGGGDGIDVVDLATNEVIDVLTVPAGNPMAVKLSLDESMLIVGTHVSIEKVGIAGGSFGSVEPGQVEQLVRHPTLPLMYETTFDGKLFEVTIDPGLSLREIPITGVMGLAVSPNGTRLYAGEEEGDVIHVWNLETGSEEPSLTTSGAAALAFSADGKFLYAVQGPNLRILEPISGIVFREVELGGWLRRVTVASDGTAIVVDNDGIPGGGDRLHFVR